MRCLNSTYVVLLGVVNRRGQWKGISCRARGQLLGDSRRSFLDSLSTLTTRSDRERAILFSDRQTITISLAHVRRVKKKTIFDSR